MFIYFILLTLTFSQLPFKNLIRDDWGSHQIVLSNINSLKAPNLYSIALRNYEQGGFYIYSTINVVALGLCGYILNTPNAFSFETNVSYSDINNTVQVSIKALDSTQLTQISFFVMIGTQRSQQFIQMLPKCFNRNKNDQSTKHNITHKTNLTQIKFKLFTSFTSFKFNTKEQQKSRSFSINDQFKNQNIIQIQIFSDSQMFYCCSITIIILQNQNIQYLLQLITIENPNDDKITNDNFALQKKQGPIFTEKYGPIYNKKCAITMINMTYLLQNNTPTLKYNVTTKNKIIFQFNHQPIILKAFCILNKCQAHYYFSYDSFSCIQYRTGTSYIVTMSILCSILGIIFIVSLFILLKNTCENKKPKQKIKKIQNEIKQPNTANRFQQ